MAGSSPLHRRDDTTAAVTREIVDYVVDRMAMSPPPLDAPARRPNWPPRRGR
ncbi:MAG: hypothetical protein R2694_04500 [Ilumatobacteraceae bacterium]